MPTTAAIDAPRSLPDSPHENIWAGIAGEKELDSFEAPGSVAEARQRIGTHAAFEGSIDPNLNTTFVNPNELVEVYLRPNRKFSQVCDPSAVAKLPPQFFDVERLDDASVNVHYLPGIKYRVSRLTLAANRAVLATPGEYAKIRAQEGTIQHQTVQREVQAMRSAIAETTDRQMTREQKERLESLRAAERAEDDRGRAAEAAQRRAVEDHKAAELVAERDKLEKMLEDFSAEDLEKHLRTLRAGTERVAANYGDKAKRELLRIAEEEAADLRARWEAIQTRRALLRQPEAPRQGTEAAAAPDAGNGSTVAQRIERLRGLLASKAITQAEFDRQLQLLV